jgi:hypothetical protein
LISLATGANTLTVVVTAPNGTTTQTTTVTVTRAAAVPPPAPPATPAAVFSPAPGITVGETRGETILAAAVPAAGADLLRGANIWVRPTSRVEYVASALPAGLTLVKGRLVAKKPGTYRVKIKVKRANGTTRMRTITVKVG